MTPAPGPRPQAHVATLSLNRKKDSRRVLSVSLVPPESGELCPFLGSRVPRAPRGLHHLCGHVAPVRRCCVPPLGPEALFGLRSHIGSSQDGAHQHPPCAARGTPGPLWTSASGLGAQAGRRRALEGCWVSVPLLRVEHVAQGTVHRSQPLCMLQDPLPTPQP